MRTDPLPPAAPARANTRHPLSIEAPNGPTPGRWLWLVKWLLVVPHLLALTVLWAAFVLATVVAGGSVLLTGRYPRRLFDFNAGVLRWTWRVGHYSYLTLESDRYPPVLVAGVHLALLQRYPQGLFDLVIGLNRWVFRVIVYVALMTDVYPPFRLDLGGTEPVAQDHRTLVASGAS